MTKPEYTPRFSLGDIVTALVAIVAAAGFAYSNAGDIKVQAQRISAIERMREVDADERQRDEARLTDALREIKDSVRRVEDKIDRQNNATRSTARPQP